MNNRFILPENFTVTAHTGCEGAPDNSMESIDKSFENCADVFEIDVQFDQNGVPVLTHNDPVGGEPALDEAFQKLVQYKNMRCNLDIKRTDNLKEIVRLAKKHGVLDRIFYTGINTDYVEAAKGTPEIPYYLNTDVAACKEQTPEYLMSLVEKIRDCGAIGINCQHSNATKELVDAFHQNGLLVSIWTCNEEADMIRILSIAPDNITTRKPGTLKALQTSYGNQLY